MKWRLKNWGMKSGAQCQHRAAQLGAQDCCSPDHTDAYRAALAARNSNLSKADAHSELLLGSYQDDYLRIFIRDYDDAIKEIVKESRQLAGVENAAEKIAQLALDKLENFDTSMGPQLKKALRDIWKAGNYNGVDVDWSKKPILKTLSNGFLKPIILILEIRFLITKMRSKMQPSQR